VTRKEELPIVISPNFVYHGGSPQRRVQGGRRRATPRLHTGPRVNNDEYINILNTLKTGDGLGIRKSPLHLTGGQHPR
jgi:hypothetical protein